MALVSFTFLLTLEYQNALAGTPDIVCRGFDPCNGTSAGEVMAGDSGPNRIKGQGGIDHVVGHGGNDELNGGDGDDSVEGNNGNDELNGGDGDDSVDDGPGDDMMSGGPGADWMTGDIFYSEGQPGFGHDTIYGNDGNDTIVGMDGIDFMYGGEGADKIYHAHRNTHPGLSSDTPPTDPDGKRDIIDCGPGNDEVWINTVDRDVALNCETVHDENEGLMREPGTGGTEDPNQAPDVDGSAKKEDGTGSQGGDALDGDDKILPEK